MIVYSVRVCDRKLEPSLVNLDANYTALHKPHFHLSCEREITKHSCVHWQGFSNCALCSFWDVCNSVCKHFGGITTNVPTKTPTPQNACVHVLQNKTMTGGGSQLVSSLHFAHDGIH